MKIRMTKNRKRILHRALSINDLLYRQFELMREDFDKRSRYVEKNYQKFIEIRRKDGQGNVHVERIKDIVKLDEFGLIIYI